jgi:hypothetical protein
VHHRLSGASRSLLVELSFHVGGRGLDLVVCIMPPRTTAAPAATYVLLNAKLSHVFSAKLPNSRPKAAPESRLGTKSAGRTAMP